jgi:hypothetical protein
MLNIKSKEKETEKIVIQLATEGPLCEKDEQAIAIERTRKLQEEALKKRKQSQKSSHQ